MRYYLDTEFLEGPQRTLFGTTKPTIDLISIGIVAEDGREYYAICNEFNLHEAWYRHQLKYGDGDQRNQKPPEKEYWIRDNVLVPIYSELVADAAYENEELFEIYEFSKWEMKHLLKRYGKSRAQIAKEIFIFCNPHIDTNTPSWTDHLNKYHVLAAENANPEFYGYFADYDWVAFCWLYGKMVDLPKGFPKYCRDLKQMLDEVADKYFAAGTNRLLTIEEAAIYPKSFEAKLKAVKAMPHYPKQENEHNALEDARWNKQLHTFINSLK